MDSSSHFKQIEIDVYTVINNVFNEREIKSIINEIDGADTSNATFVKQRICLLSGSFLKDCLKLNH